MPLGLGHPDEAGQEVVAIMNSYGLGLPVDTVQPDDIAGARALYGGAGTAGRGSWKTRAPGRTKAGSA